MGRVRKALFSVFEYTVQDEAGLFVVRRRWAGTQVNDGELGRVSTVLLARTLIPEGKKMLQQKPLEVWG